VARAATPIAYGSIVFRTARRNRSFIPEVGSSKTMLSTKASWGSSFLRPYYYLTRSLTATMGVVISAGRFAIRSRGLGEGRSRPAMDRRSVGILPAPASRAPAGHRATRLDFFGTSKFSRLKAFHDNAKKCLGIIVSERCVILVSETRPIYY
jgi:hypothetical protein